MLTQVQQDAVHTKYRAAFPEMTDEEKTIKWLERIILPKFFEENEFELLSDLLAFKLQDIIDKWQRDKVRQDNTKVDVAYTGNSITVKVNQKLICTFN